MTTGLYAIAVTELAGGGSINWTADTICAVPVIQGYIPNLAADQYLSDVPSRAVPTTAQALTSKTKTAVPPYVEYDADDVTFPSVEDIKGPILGILLYKDTGVPGTSILIGYFDNMSNLTLSTTGNDVIVVWVNGPGKIFYQ